VGRKRKAVDQSSYSGRVASQLVRLREEAGLSVDEVVEKVNKAGYEVSIATLKHWENNRIKVNIDAIPYLAKSLKVKPHDIWPKR